MSTPKFKAGDKVYCRSLTIPQYAVVYEILAILSQREAAMRYPISKSEPHDDLEMVYVVRWLSDRTGITHIFTFTLDNMDNNSGCVLYDSPEGIWFRL